MRDTQFQITSGQRELPFGIWVKTRAACRDIVAVLKKHGYTNLKVRGPGPRWRLARAVPEYGSDWYCTEGPGAAQTFRTEAEARKALAVEQPKRTYDLTIKQFTGQVTWALEDL